MITENIMKNDYPSAESNQGIQVAMAVQALLNLPNLWQATQPPVQSNTAPLVQEPRIPIPAVKLTPPPFMNSASRQDVITGFKELVKEVYEAGVPMGLTDALKTYCRYVDRKPSKDELSRVRIIERDMNDPYLHELTADNFSSYEAAQLKELSVRTIEERLALVKRIYDLLMSKRVYRGTNPLSYWKPSVSAKVRKEKAAAGIASIERVCTVFGSHEFALFGQTHRAFYLVMITAVVTGMRITSICRLKSTDLMLSLDGIPIIDLGVDKTPAGKRQIPIPTRLHTALKDYLREHGKFPFADRGKDKGCSDAISKLYKEFIAQYPGFNLFGLNPHGLRASLNNHLHKINVPIDMRCAFIGHKNNHVNSVFYSEPTEIDLLELNVKGVQEKLLNALQFDQHVTAGEEEATK
jgi:integrase